MVAERTQVRSCLTCKFFDCVHKIFSRVFSTQAMANVGDFIPGAGHTMTFLQQREEQAETISLFIALVGTARAFLPLGRQMAKMMV